MRTLNIFLLTLFLSTIVFADNPIIQNLYSADPAPMVYKDRVYLYTSHDEDKNTGGFTMQNWMCYSSTDMVNWTDHGIVASLKDLNWHGANNGAWAPQCVERNGKFYLYVPIQGHGIGVLVADNPLGPFKDPINKALVHAHGWDDIDPTAFVDSDGQAYLYWGNPNLWYVKLNENMTSYSGNVVEVKLTEASFGKRTVYNAKRPTSYEEGPFFYKRNDLYYMVFAVGPPSPEHIAHSTSTGPTGPWTYRGLIMTSIPKGAFTNHPGVCDFKGNSYLFYHNQALSGDGYKRSVCVEQFTYKSDGSIPQISSTTNGPNQVGSLNPYDTVQAETICWGQGVETEVCSEGGINVSNIENGDYIKVKGVDFDKNAIKFEARVASNTSGGKIELRLDSQSGKLIGTCNVSGTGGWQNWTTVSCDVSGASAKHDLYLKFTGGSGFLFNVNWWKFTPEVSNEVEKNFDAHTAKNLNIKIEQSKKTVTLRLNSSSVRNQNVRVDLFNVSGRKIKSFLNEKSAQTDIAMDLSGIRSGTYLVKVVAGNSSITKAVTIQ